MRHGRTSYISPSLWLWSYLSPFLRYGDSLAKNCVFFLYPLSFGAPSPCPLLEFRADVNHEKTMGLSSSEDRMIVAWVVWHVKRLWQIIAVLFQRLWSYDPTALYKSIIIIIIIIIIILLAESSSSAYKVANTTAYVVTWFAHFALARWSRRRIQWLPWIRPTGEFTRPWLWIECIKILMYRYFIFYLI